MIEQDLFRMASALMHDAGHLTAYRPAPQPRPVDSPFLDIEEAASYCRMSKGTLYNAVYHGKLAKQPGTRKVLFRREDLDAFLTTKPKRRR